MSGNVDFTAFVFPFGTQLKCPVYGDQFSESTVISFQNAVFYGDADFAKVRFTQRVEFKEAKFHGTAGFTQARFYSGCDFSRVEFLGHTNFTSAVFCDLADFWGAKFLRIAAFMGTTFERVADFRRTEFEGSASFLSAQFRDTADFRETTFRDAATFLSTAFRGEAIFMGSDSERVFAPRSDAVFQEAIFSESEQVAFRHVFLGRAQFLGSDVRQVDFTDVDWARRPFWGPRWEPLVARHDRLGSIIRCICRVWPNWLRPRGRYAVADEFWQIGKDEDKSYALIRKLYRQLQYNYEDHRDPVTAGDFHFGEMHMRRLSDPPGNGCCVSSNATTSSLSSRSTGGSAGTGRIIA